MNDVWYSMDGVNWTTATNHAQWPERGFHASVVFAGKMWVLGGAQNLLYNRRVFADAWYSSDGVKWTSASLNSFGSGIYGHAAVVFQNKIWVISGKGCFYSNDATTWSVATRLGPWKGWDWMQAVVYDNRIWVMGGNGGQPNDGCSVCDVWSSADGVHWTQVSYYAWPPREAFGAVVFRGKIWVLGGSMGYGPHGGLHAWLNDVWYYAPGPSAAKPFWTWFR